MSEYSTAGATLRDLKALIAAAELRGLRDDAIVVIAKDSEGNAFSPLYTANEDGLYRPESSYAGEVAWWDEDDVEDAGPDRQTWSEWYAETREEGGLPCLVLWPTN